MNDFILFFIVVFGFIIISLSIGWYLFYEHTQFEQCIELINNNTNIIGCKGIIKQ